MLRKRRFNHHVDEVGAIVESDVILTETREEWEESPESKTGEWSVLLEDDGSVLANRLLGVPVVGHLLGVPGSRIDL